MRYAIEVEELWWKYESSDHWILKNINLRIKEGEFIGIIGPSGAGKTTLCLCLVGIIPHAIKGTMKGHVRIYGKDSRNSSIISIVEDVGVVFQDPEVQFVTMRVIDEIAFTLENMGVPRDVMLERIDEVLTMIDMKGYEHKHPLELSGGQKQRVAIASMLARRPRIMILDEPTSDLDTRGKEEVFRTLLKLRNLYGITTVFVSHDIEELARHADRIILLKNGEIVLDGRPSIFFSKGYGMYSIPVPQITELYYRLLELKLIPKFPSIPITIEELIPVIKRLSERTKLLNPPDPVSHETGNTIISLRNVFFTYPDGTKALKGIDLDIREGEFVFIIGPNGSGKTTLLKIITGLLKPTYGEVYIFGKSIHELSVNDIALKIGLVYQNPDHQLFCNTVYEECAYALRNMGMKEDEIRNRVEKVLKYLDLIELKNTPPFFLSKGQRQRLALAVVLAMEPKVIIVDEPTTGQDYIQSQYIMDFMKKIHENGKTIIIVTHNMRLVADYAQRVVVMKNGKILADGTSRQILTNTELLRESGLASPQIVQLTSKVFNVPLLNIKEFIDAIGGLS